MKVAKMSDLGVYLMVLGGIFSLTAVFEVYIYLHKDEIRRSYGI